LIEREHAAVVGARVFAIGTEECVVASALAINPDGMILMPVIISRDTVVEVGGEGSLRHHGAEDGDGSAGELHCAIVLWNWLEDEVVEEFLDSLMLKFCVDLDVVDGGELILIEIQVGLIYPTTSPLSLLLKG
jgi:hypothetical protein